MQKPEGPEARKTPFHWFYFPHFHYLPPNWSPGNVMEALGYLSLMYNVVDRISAGILEDLQAIQDDEQKEYGLKTRMDRIRTLTKRSFPMLDDPFLDAIDNLANRLEELGRRRNVILKGFVMLTDDGLQAIDERGRSTEPVSTESITELGKEFDNSAFELQQWALAIRMKRQYKESIAPPQQG